MEAVLSTLPEAARIAARASASMASLGQPPAAPAEGGGAKEPTLAELLKAQKLSLTDGDVRAPHTVSHSPPGPKVPPPLV